MKKKLTYLFAVLLIAAFAMPACASASLTEAPASENIAVTEEPGCGFGPIAEGTLMSEAEHVNGALYQLTGEVKLAKDGEYCESGLPFNINDVDGSFLGAYSYGFVQGEVEDHPETIWIVGHKPSSETGVTTVSPASTCDEIVPEGTPLRYVSHAILDSYYFSDSGPDGAKKDAFCYGDYIEVAADYAEASVMSTFPEYRVAYRIADGFDKIEYVDVNTAWNPEFFGRFNDYFEGVTCDHYNTHYHDSGTYTVPENGFLMVSGPGFDIGPVHYGTNNNLDGTFTLYVATDGPYSILLHNYVNSTTLVWRCYSDQVDSVIGQDLLKFSVAPIRVVRVSHSYNNIVADMVWTK